MRYDLSPEDCERIDRDFTYHAPHGDQTERYGCIRSSAKCQAKIMLTFCPPSRERSLALTKLEEAVFWANAAIARNEPAPPKIVEAGDGSGGR